MFFPISKITLKDLDFYLFIAINTKEIRVRSENWFRITDWIVYYRSSSTNFLLFYWQMKTHWKLVSGESKVLIAKTTSSIFNLEAVAGGKKSVFLVTLNFKGSNLLGFFIVSLSGLCCLSFNLHFKSCGQFFICLFEIWRTCQYIHKVCVLIVQTNVCPSGMKNSNLLTLSRIKKREIYQFYLPNKMHVLINEKECLRMTTTFLIRPLEDLLIRIHLSALDDIAKRRK